MTREEKILLHVDKNGRGIEIGPGPNPIAPKREGYKVQVIDHMGRDKLIKTFAAHNMDTKKIEDVDFIWKGESYSELTGKNNYYDWIIASHVIEHVPDLIRFLKECEDILNDDGVLSLAVPDKRFCFDYYRPITGISRIIDSYYQKLSIHSPGSMVEFYLNAVTNSGIGAWSNSAAKKMKFTHSVDEAKQRLELVTADGKYHDVHAWCFVPHSFRLIIHDLNSLGLISLKEVSFSSTVGCEFYITLGKKGSGAEISRMEMVDRIEYELFQSYLFGKLPYLIIIKTLNLIKRIFRKIYQY
ncbi:MAG: methyltransferase domain-containing protein [Gammaproteobacteria bacterium]|nr:methyltransferase domain-containing protein [Gammaproteobacteria bacterium]